MANLRQKLIFHSGIKQYLALGFFKAGLEVGKPYTWVTYNQDPNFISHPSPSKEREPGNWLRDYVGNYSTIATVTRKSFSSKFAAKHWHYLGIRFCYWNKIDANPINWRLPSFIVPKIRNYNLIGRIWLKDFTDFLYVNQWKWWYYNKYSLSFPIAGRWSFHHLLCFGSSILLKLERIYLFINTVNRQ